MANKTLPHRRPLLALVALVIVGLAAVAYAQYRSTVTSAEEAALKAELFRANDAIDAQKADAGKVRGR